MPTPQREPLRRLSRAERAALQRIVHSRSERVDRVRRATALLAVARTGVFIQAAREAGLHSGTTVADLVARFNRVGLAAVSIAPGRGRKAAYLLSARAQIVATAQREPDRRTDGTATWSLSTLQHALRRAGLKRVGTSTIRRVLQEAGSAYQRTRTWCPTGTAQRKRKSGVVTVVDPKTEEKRSLIDQAYRLAEAMGIPLWCQDEAGPYQAIPQPGQSWQPEGKPRRQPHEYIRGGTAKLLTLFRPATGEVRAKGVPRAPNVVLHPLVTARTARGAGGTARGIYRRRRPAVSRALGHLVGRCSTSATATTPLDFDLGQSEGSFEHVDRHLVVRSRGHAAVHAAEWLMAEHGGIRPAHHLWAGLERPASADGGASDHLVGGCGCRLERQPDSVRMGRQTTGAPSPCRTTSSPALECHHHSPANCGMTH